MEFLRPSFRHASSDLRLLSTILGRGPAQRRQRHLRGIVTDRSISSTSSARQDGHSSPNQSSSVSQSEVSHFTALAASWWDPHGPSRLLHLMNPLRHDFIQTCLQNSPDTEILSKRKTYLDIGCGGGIFASSAARLISTDTVTAIDPTPSVIQVAKEQQRTDPMLVEPKLRYLNCAVEELDMNEAPVDILTVFEVLEHVSSPAQFLQTCVPHIKPGGWIFGSTIARSPLSFLTTKVIAEAPFIGVVPPGTHDWDKYINPNELSDWFGQQTDSLWGPIMTQGVIYLPGLGWKMVNRSESLGNFFFGVQKLS